MRRYAVQVEEDRSMSDTAPEEKKTAPDGIARSLEEKERKNSGERPETKGDEPADNTRQRALSQCINIWKTANPEYSHRPTWLNIWKT